MAKKILHVSIVLIITLISTSQISSREAPITAANNGGKGFTVELIRRDSPKSPYSTAIISPDSTQSTISPENAQYLIKLAVGTPATDVFVILDSGSDLFWVQCLPCTTCYQQIKPIYDPSKSTSFAGLSCQSDQCKLVATTSCEAAGSCSYVYGYGSGSTAGNMATEKVAVAGKSGGVATFNKVVFGCGHNNSGTFNQNEMGLMGFGKGPSSFISQVGPSVGGKKFSYCLMPFNTDPAISSTVTLGSGSEVQGAGVITIPIAPSPDITSYYFTLNGISVGTTLVPYSSTGPAQTANVVLDSGTPPNLFPRDFYDRLAAEVKRQIPLTPISGDLCYENADQFEAPTMTLHFDGGVDLPLSTVQTFIRKTDGTVCFASQPSPDGTAIIGNFAQANFLIGYDLEQMTISFKPTDCTKFG